MPVTIAHQVVVIVVVPISSLEARVACARLLCIRGSVRVRAGLWVASDEAKNVRYSVLGSVQRLRGSVTNAVGPCGEDVHGFHACTLLALPGQRRLLDHVGLLVPGVVEHLGDTGQQGMA